MAPSPANANSLYQDLISDAIRVGGVLIYLYIFFQFTWVPLYNPMESLEFISLPSNLNLWKLSLKNQISETFVRKFDDKIMASLWRPAVYVFTLSTKVLAIFCLVLLETNEACNLILYHKHCKVHLSLFLLPAMWSWHYIILQTTLSTSIRRKSNYIYFISLSEY